MLDAEHQATVTEPPVKPRRTGLIALVAIVILAVAGVGAWLLLRGGEKTPTDVVQDLAIAMREDDMNLLTDTVGPEDNGFVEWQIGWNAKPSFSDITESDALDGTWINANVTYSNDSFYSQVLGRTLTTTLTGSS